jgi:hypothetical protein
MFSNVCKISTFLSFLVVLKNLCNLFQRPLYFGAWNLLCTVWQIHTASKSGQKNLPPIEHNSGKGFSKAELVGNFMEKI